MSRSYCSFLATLGNNSWTAFYRGDNTDFGQWMAGQSGLMQWFCLLCFPTITGDLKPSYHSTGKIFLPILGLIATAYILVFLFYFFSSLWSYLLLRMTVCLYIFLYYVFAILGWRWEVEGWFSLWNHRPSWPESPDLYFRKLSLEWVCSGLEGIEAWNTNFTLRDSSKKR